MIGEELRRRGKREAAPFSKVEPQSDPKPSGHKPGESYGQQTCRPAHGGSPSRSRSIAPASVNPVTEEFVWSARKQLRCWVRPMQAPYRRFTHATASVLAGPSSAAVQRPAGNGSGRCRKISPPGAGHPPRRLGDTRATQGCDDQSEWGCASPRDVWRRRCMVCSPDTSLMPGTCGSPSTCGATRRLCFPGTRGDQLASRARDSARHRAPQVVPRKSHCSR